MSTEAEVVHYAISPGGEIACPGGRRASTNGVTMTMSTGFAALVTCPSCRLYIAGDAPLVSARDDYPADGARGGTAELRDGAYERMCAELDSLRAELERARSLAVRCELDQSGMGKVWRVTVGGVLVWSHAAIEGPEPGALGLFDTLARWTGLRTQELAGEGSDG